MAHGLTNGTSNEDDVCYAQDWPSSKKIGKHSGHQTTNQGSKSRSGCDQFLLSLSISMAAEVKNIWGKLFYLLSRGQLRWAEVGTYSYQSTRDDPGIIPYNRIEDESDFGTCLDIG